MLFILILLVLIHSSIIGSKNVGSTLFYKLKRNDCWNEDDVARLIARREFENIILPEVTPDKITKQYIKNVIKYYRKALTLVENNTDAHTTKLLKDAMADTIGGHLKCELLPTVKFAYYAGYVPHKTVGQLNEFRDELITYLNTKGVGWSTSDTGSELRNITVVKILIGPGKLFDPCDSLVLKRNTNSCIQIPMPKTDDESNPIAIALPFKTGGLFSLVSPSSENIFLKYYTTASRCLLHRSPKKCRHSDLVKFNNGLWHWMKRNVAPHIVDDQVYVAYGGVLRVAAAVQKYDTGSARRDTVSRQKPPHLKQNNKITFLDSNVVAVLNWTPMLYISLVILAATSIYFVHICYSQLFFCNFCNKGQSSAKSNETHKEEIAYTQIESNFPAMLPHDQPTLDDAKKSELYRSKTKVSSYSIRTQNVYDMNEDKEKLMDVLVSNDDNSTDESFISNHGEAEVNRFKSLDCQSSNHPPKIEAQVAQLRLQRTSVGKTRALKVLSNSTTSQSTCHPEVVSAWSGSYSSSCEDSCSTSSSESRSCISRNSRNLAWAKRAIAKHKLTQSAGTEFTSNSYTTLPLG